jgi:HEAT repeat protein
MLAWWIGLVSQAEIHSMVLSEDRNKKEIASSLLGDHFSEMPDKEQAWQDLCKLVQDEDNQVRWRAVLALESAYCHIPNIALAWQTLHKLTLDKDISVRRCAVNTLEGVFSSIPDKVQAWQDLMRLTQDKDESVRFMASSALGVAFCYAQDKIQAWRELRSLLLTKDYIVRRGYINSFEFAFPYIPDNNQAWQDLHEFTLEKDYAYFALGRACIFEATEVINDKEFKTYIGDVINFFEKSAKEVPSSNPAAFCLPFYKSLFNILYTSVPIMEEIQRYLDEARKAIIESESKELLLEAVENLSKALEEVRSYTTGEIISRSKAYTRYCIQAAECLREVNSKAPYASKIVDAIAVEKGIIVLDDKIKSLFKDVEVAARDLCMRSRGTSQEGLDRSNYEKIKSLNQVSSLIDAELFFDEKIIPILEANISRLPVLSKTYFLNRMKSKDAMTLEDRFELVKDVLHAVLIQGENNDQYREILELLRNIEFSFSKRQNLSSTELRLSLNKLQAEINNINNTLQSQGQSLEKLGILIKEIDIAEYERLE